MDVVRINFRFIGGGGGGWVANIRGVKFPIFHNNNLTEQFTIVVLRFRFWVEGGGLKRTVWWEPNIVHKSLINVVRAVLTNFGLSIF